MLRIMHTKPRRMLILGTNRGGVSRLLLAFLTRLNNRFFSVLSRPDQALPRLINLMRIRPTLMLIRVRHIYRFVNGAVSMVHVRPNTKRRNRRGIRSVLTVNSKGSVQHMHTNRHQLTRIIRLLINSTMTNRVHTIRNQLRVRHTILRIRRRHRSLQVIYFNRSRDVRSNMIIRVARVLRRVRHRLLTQRDTFTRFTSRQLPMTFLPCRINNFTRPLHR